MFLLMQVMHLVFGSNAISVTPETVMDQFGNQVQSQMGNNYNPGRPIGGSNVTAPPGLPRPIVPPEQGGGGRPPGGGGSGITTLPDGTVYNPGRPMPPEQGGITNAQDTTLPGLPALNLQTAPMQQSGLPRPIVGGRPIGGGPSPYEGPMKTMNEFGSNIFVKGPGALEAAYEDYKKKYNEYQSNKAAPKIGTAEEEYAKIQEGKNRPSRDLRYGENMSFEEFKAEYDAEKTPMQQGPYKGLFLFSSYHS